MNRNSIYLNIAAGLIAIFACTGSLAGKKEIDAARAITITITMYEKCTGDSPSQDKMQRMVKRFVDNGMTPKDFEAGAMQALIFVENEYPGQTKPSKEVCREATKTYRGVFGDM